MKFKRQKKWKSRISIALVVVLIFSVMPDTLKGIIQASAADPEITSTSNSYTFTTAGKAAPVVGGILDGTSSSTTSGIYYYSGGTSSTGTSTVVGFDTASPYSLRFRENTVLYLPIKSDTTKVTFSETGSQAVTTADRLTYIGSKTSGYSVKMSSSTTSVTVSDITDYIQVINGQSYLPIISGGDVKLKNITLKEYNPINSVNVTGTVEKAVADGITQITFHNQADTTADNDIIGTLDASGNYSVTLRRVSGNASYLVSVANTGYKVNDTDNGNIITLTGNNASQVNNFEVVSDAFATLSGTVSGIPDTDIKGDLSLTLVPENTALSSVTVSITKVNGTYTYSNVTVASSSNYTATLTNADDYEVVKKINKDKGTYADVDISATKKTCQSVTGSFVTSDKKTATVTKIKFTNITAPDYSYEFSVTGNTYSATLRTGEYVTSAVVDGYTVFDHVSVKDSAVTNDVYLVAPEDTSPVAYEDTITVGKGQRFEKISDAMKYIKRMTRTDDQRVTVTLTDELYREQIVVDTPNVTIIGINSKSTTVTWYYGVGYSYYSAEPVNLYYDQAYAVDKYTTNKISMLPGHWGSTVNLSINAKGFRSESVIYENSFNRYMTAEEVADGVGEGGDNAKVNRSIATDIDIKLFANKERACTMFIEADDSEFNNCSFLSSQDTLFTGDTTESTYFKNCIIEGTTDYICGDGNAVFDGCTLSMYGYGDKAASGSIIVASKNLAPDGYLFNNCKVVKTTYPGINTSITSTFLARPWRAGSKVTFLNTEVQSTSTIAPAGYTSMSNVSPAEAIYSEYNTHTPDGTPVSTSSRASGIKKMTASDAAGIVLTSYFGDWNAFYYYSQPADYSAVDAAIGTANKLITSEYVDFSSVTKSINDVVKTYKIADQSKVDAMAKAITDAINALVKKADLPADYTAVDSAIASANNLTVADYVDFSGVTKAINAVVRGNKAADQSKVDAMAKAITDAINALVKKADLPANYTAVDSSIAIANKLIVADYVDFSGVTKAINAVVRGNKAADQSKVDSMAKAITDAVNALVKKADLPADYTAVDSAIAAANKLTKTDYTDFSGVTKAIDAVVRGNKAAVQSKVDAMAKAITDAVNALVKVTLPNLPISTLKDVICGKNAPSAKLDTTIDDLESSLFSQDELNSIKSGTASSVVLNIENKDTTVSADDQQLIKTALNGNTVGLYLDINLLKTVGEKSDYVKETTKPVRITLEVPASLKNTNSEIIRTFKIVKAHNGVSEVLENLDKSQNTLIFDTSQFSTYAIVYSDTSVNSNTNASSGTGTSTVTNTTTGSESTVAETSSAVINQSDEVKTSDNNNTMVFIFILVISGCLLILGSKKRIKTEL